MCVQQGQVQPSFCNYLALSSHKQSVQTFLRLSGRTRPVGIFAVLHSCNAGLCPLLPVHVPSRGDASLSTQECSIEPYSNKYLHAHTTAQRLPEACFFCMLRHVCTARAALQPPMRWADWHCTRHFRMQSCKSTLAWADALSNTLSGCPVPSCLVAQSHHAWLPYSVRSVICCIGL